MDHGNTPHSAQTSPATRNLEKLALAQLDAQSELYSPDPRLPTRHRIYSNNTQHVLLHDKTKLCFF